MFSTDEIKRFTGLGDSQIEVLVRTFSMELEIAVTQIKKLQEQENWAAIRELAHKLKPSFFLMGIKEAEPLLLYLNHFDINSPDKQTTFNHLQLVHSLISDLLPHLRAHLRSTQLKPAYSNVEHP